MDNTAVRQEVVPIATLEWAPGLCVLHKQHRPQPALLEKHHYIPVWMQMQVWGKIKLPETIIVCPTGHTNLHVYIDHMVRSMYKSLPYISRNEKRYALAAVVFALDNKL